MEKRVSPSLGIHKKSITRHKRNRKSNKKSLVKKVLDYLLSDSYMYAPLVHSTNINTSPSTAISNKKVGMQHEEAREQQENLNEKDSQINGVSDSFSPSPLGRREKVKHMVHYSAHILSGQDHGTAKNKFAATTEKPVLNSFVTSRSK